MVDPNAEYHSNGPATTPELGWGVRAVIAFTALYMIAAVPAALSARNSEFLFYIGVMSVLIAAVTAVHLKVGLSTAALWALSTWGLFHMAGGLVRLPAGWPLDSGPTVLYNLWLTPIGPKYDQFVHAYGFAVLTWVFWQVYCKRTPVPARPTFGIMVLCAAASMGFGALNEMVEFIATLLFANTNVGGYKNTGWDLVSNAVGAISAAVVIRLRAASGGRK